MDRERGRLWILKVGEHIIFCIFVATMEQIFDITFGPV